MNRLSVRLFLSHLLVAVVGAATTYAVVRLLAPNLFDTGVRRMGQMMGAGPGGLRSAFASAVNTSLLVGLLISAAAAAGVAAVAAYRLLRPLVAVRTATRRLAQGHYDEQVVPPREVELADLVHDVNDLAARLADTERRRLRLLSDVAHEMRTPLTVIGGYVEGMLDGVFDAEPATLEPVAAELHRLSRLADDLSALSRAEEHALELRLQSVDVDRVVASTAERLRPQFDEARVRLVVTPSPTPITVRADPDRLGQVLTNLLGNALRATDTGRRVEVRTGRHGGRVTITVSDEGEGLAAEDLERVFERFYRAGGRRPDGDRHGSGIGLTIARGIARAHGGDVTATSAGPGQGATFTVTLPGPG